MRRIVADTRPCYRYLKNDGDWWAAAHILRGLPYFEAMTTVRHDGHTTRVAFENGFDYPPRCTNEIMITSMPNWGEQSEPYIAKYAARISGLVVDVTGDIWKLIEGPSDAIDAAENSVYPTSEYLDDYLRGGEAGRTLSKAQWQENYAPRFRGRVYRACLMAAVVTTPWKWLVEPLAEFTDCRVVHLPDWTGDGTEWTDAWEQRVLPAIGATR